MQLLGSYKHFCPCICHVQGSKVMLEGSDLGMSIDEVRIIIDTIFPVPGRGI